MDNKEYPDHTKHPVVKKVMKGITRTHGVPKKQAAAMTLNDIDRIVANLDSQGDSLEAARE